MSNIQVDQKAWARAEILRVSIITVALLALCFALPIATRNVTSTWYKTYNQYPIGALVNTALIYSALRFKKFYNVIGVVLLPSICVASLTLIGINAVFMMYMIPFIWLGNMAIVLSFRLLFKSHSINARNIDAFVAPNKTANKAIIARYSMTAVIGIMLKVALIFGGYLVMREAGVFPAPVAKNLYRMMGIVQIITATSGAIIFAVTSFTNHSLNRR